MIGNFWILVDFFFVLSGFVISNAYLQTLGVKAGPARIQVVGFLAKRIWRLYPLHLITMIGVGTIQLAAWRFLGAAFPFGEGWPWLVALNLTLTQAIGLADTAILNVPSWSISTELFAYLLFALIALVFRNARSRTYAFIGASLLALAAMRAFQARYGLQLPANNAVLRCFYSFGLGVMTYAGFVLIGRGALHALAVCIASVVTILGLLIVGVVMTIAVPLDPLLLGMPPLFAAIILAMALDSGSWVKRALESRWLLYFGKRSYSVYLNHVLVLMVVSACVSRLSQGKISVGGFHNLHNVNVIIGDIALFGYFIILAIVSILTYKWVEMPGRDHGRRLAKRIGKETS
jgi:peptidoglycan/LPS O-acetylase OafA/YrhL